MKAYRSRVFRGIFLLSALLLAGCSEKEPSLRPLASDAVILAFGDSLTYGTGAGSNQSYPSVLAELTGRQVINAGIPGEVSASGVKRLGILLEKHQPDLVVLCHGGNDILRRLDRDSLSTNLVHMIEEIRNAGADVLLLAVPDFGLLLSAAEFYGEVAAKTAVPVELDILPDVLADRRLKSDTIHPNADGYRRLAEAIAAKLEIAGAL